MGALILDGSGGEAEVREPSRPITVPVADPLLPSRGHIRDRRLVACRYVLHTGFAEHNTPARTTIATAEPAAIRPTTR
jgi:hypothetical protein